ncbi:TasA family protein [Methanonatronarchaeum sp. AMET-Sl]|uniref:TasA family protein n=1 Tax=Methanonatronarchaeum sp. AMET-Sl TaxID=3037654 RepID=UPI00244E159A|nr:TasA family protein [Methanonatronarchaeum sp. AMET-Sl]WGI17120.1 TasA family protein [Methanonatronarchaeum sp. AMET-Sl]
MISKKALFSVLLIGLIGVAAGAGTFAYFSDTEMAEGNTLTAGTIDIAINDQNPWTETFHFDDMKPCEETKYANVTITNEGTNEAKIFKQIDVTDYNTGLERFECPDPECNEMFSSEPEWDAETELVEGERILNRVDDIHNVTDYSLEIIVNEVTTTVYEIGDETTVGDIDGQWMYLGILEPGDSMTVNQDYHLQSDAGNEYQGDQFTFDMTFMALQTNDNTTIQDYNDLTPDNGDNGNDNGDNGTPE